MSTDIQLANMALLELGKDRITSFDDGTEEANWINEIFDEVRQECIGDGPWSFATKRAELALLDSTPEYEYSYEFQLPTDFISLLEINEEAPGTYPHRVENGKLLIDNSSVEVKYIFDNTDVGAWPPYFKKVFIKWLTYRLAYWARADLNLKRSLWQEYQAEKNEGLALDGKQGSHDRFSFDEFTEDR